jgi:hypothetical protein
VTEKVDGCCHGCEKAIAWRHINRELLLPRLQYLNETWSTKIGNILNQNVTHKLRPYELRYQKYQAFDRAS